jgi:hypothetical protein
MSLPDTVPNLDAGGSNSNSNLKKRSKCWNDFDELTKIVNSKKIRYVARCKHCKQTLSVRSTSGTEHLHRRNCLAKKAHEHSGQAQFVLKYNVDGTLQRWEYSASIARTISMLGMIFLYGMYLCFFPMLYQSCS